MEQNLKVRKPEGFYLQKNLEHIDPELAETIKSYKHTETPVDSDITIMGANNPVVTVFVGFSTRKLIDSIKRKKKRIDLIVVIEPNVGQFKEVLMTEDISDLLTNPNVEFLVGCEPKQLLPELFKILSKNEKGSYISRVGKIRNMEKIVDPFTFKSLEHPVAKEIDDKINETIHHISLSMGCSDDQSTRWEMMFDNRDVMTKAWSAADLFGKFHKTPAIVLGGGPSLDEFIEKYKAEPKLHNGIIIAVDAVLKKLLDNGIKPHIVTRCERKKTQIFKGITKEMTKSIYYAAYPWTDNSFFDLFDDCFYLFRSNGVCVFTDIKHAFVDGGVSSGNAALELALCLGCPQIMLSGIDLCMIDGQTHTKDTMVEFNPENSKAKWTKIKCNDGEERTTIPVWTRCWNEYTQSVDKHLMGVKNKPEKHKPFSVFNTSSRGAVIEKIEYKPWDELIQYFDGENNVLERLEKHRKKIPEEQIENFNKRCKEAKELMEEIAEAIDITEGLDKDAQRTADRELEKILLQTEELKEEKPWIYLRRLRGHGPNYNKLCKNVAETFDTNFKNKYLGHLYYRLMLMDVLQLDTYHYENQINALANTIEFENDRYLEYASITKAYLKKVKYYAQMFTKMIK